MGSETKRNGKKGKIRKGESVLPALLTGGPADLLFFFPLIFWGANFALGLPVPHQGPRSWTGLAKSERLAWQAGGLSLWLFMSMGLTDSTQLEGDGQYDEWRRETAAERVPKVPRLPQ